MGKRLTTQDFIEKAVLVHGAAFNYIKSEYITAHIKVLIICNTCGNEFLQTPNSHLYTGNGCSKCAFNKNAIKSRSNTNEFIRKSLLINNNAEMYLYNKIDYINNTTLVEIICKEHGSFFQSPGSHLRGRGCLKCHLKTAGNINLFIIKAQKIHGDTYCYLDGEYLGSLIPIKIKCYKHGYFFQKPNTHLNKKNIHGCPKCNLKVSLIETLWLDSLGVEKRQVKLNNLKQFIVDGFDPKTNTVYEFHGDYWHGNPKKYKSTDKNPHNKTEYGILYSRTLKKESDIRAAGYNLIVVWESDWRVLNGK